MEIITVNSSNIDKEHICCAISDVKGENCVASKKAWMKERFKDGLVFKKLNARGKVFIEYLPAENAWCPVEAPGYMFINCFWVSGQYAGKGYGSLLLQECLEDARAMGKKGVVVMSSQVKKPFLSDPRYLKHKGFRIGDTAQPFYELLYLPFEEGSEPPRFKPCAKSGPIQEDGLMLCYSHQCPFSEKYALLIAETAHKKGIPIKLKKYNTKEEAQNAPVPSTSYSLFYNGGFITNEILSESKFLGLLSKLSL